MTSEFDAELFEGESPVALNESFDCVIIVDGLPIVPKDKFQKLESVVRKIFAAFGEIVDIYLPMPQGKTLGYCFIEYTTAEIASGAANKGDNKKLDAKHQLRCNLFSQLDELQNLPSEYSPPEKAVFELKTNTSSWLLDEHGRDQFVVRFGDHTHVYWNDPLRQANDKGRVLQYGGEREIANHKKWTEFTVAWSPQGSYLATFHAQGIMLWGGEDFQQIGKFAHRQVMELDFSPKENYLVTTNFIERSDEDPNPSIQIWDTVSGRMLRGFDNPAKKWPSFLWSHNDKYLMRMGVVSKGNEEIECVSIYETPSMGLLDKASLPIPGLAAVAWSPSDDIFAYYVPEKGDLPCRIGLVAIPSREVIREKHLFNVSDVKLHWQSDGDFLCVEVTRRKTKKTLYTAFEIFRMRQKDIPIESEELEDSIVHFSWEPHGSRFGVIHGEKGKRNVTLYRVLKKNLKPATIPASERITKLFWSPMGDYVVMASPEPEGSHVLVWVDTATAAVIGQQEHFMLTNVEWDPSGRYVMSSVTTPLEASGRHTMESAYKVFSSQGQLLHTVPVEKCYQIMWRPRPASLLTKEEQEAIKEALKEKYWNTFQAEDDAIKQSQATGAARERELAKQEWIKYRLQTLEEWRASAPDRQALRRGQLSENEDDFTDAEHEEEEEISMVTAVLQ